MGQSTDGQICYGIVCEEGFEFPWGDYGEEEWWLKVKGYKPPFELYDDAGNHINGMEPTQEQTREYFAHKRDWEKGNPMPVTLINYCSGDSPMWIIATPSSVKTARRGYPEEIESELLVVPLEVDGLMAFVREHLPELKGEPKWWLSSYWG